MNRFIEFIHHDEPRPEIDKYENHAILSINAALQPLLTSIDHLDDYIKQAKDLSNDNTQHDLNQDQRAAVYLYTNDYSEQSLHRQINKALDSGDKESIKPWLGFLHLFNSALEKLPTVTKTIYRGLPKNIETQLRDKSEIVFWQYVSCSTSIDIIKQFVNENSVVCSIESINAKNITGYTPYPNDLEVLLLPGTCLHVKSTNCFEEVNTVHDTEMRSPQESDDEQETHDNMIIETNDRPNKSVIMFGDGGFYKATYINGKKQGHGTYHNIDDIQAEGQEADDRANGEGACTFANHDCFVGTYKQGIRQGFGILYHKNGTIEIGNWVDDELKEKHDSKTSSNGEKYSWKDQNETEHCYGIYYDNKGNRFLGNIIDDKAHGLGVRFWNDNIWYQGSFQNDKKHGYGIYFDHGKGHYVGCWENDEMNGLGRIIWKSKTKFEGCFKDGKRQGQGKLTFIDKKPQQGNWENDVYVD